MKARILKCTNGKQSWYYNLIGGIVEIWFDPNWAEYYRLKGKAGSDGYLLTKGDVEIINE